MDSADARHSRIIPVSNIIHLLHDTFLRPHCRKDLSVAVPTLHRQHDDARRTALM